MLPLALRPESQPAALRQAWRTAQYSHVSVTKRRLPFTIIFARGTTMQRFEITQRAKSAQK